MKTEHLSSGPVTHGYSDAMITVATEELLAFLKEHGPQRPGDLEDQFAGTILDETLGAWRRTPHFPALGRLVSSGDVEWWKDNAGVVFYSSIQKPTPCPAQPAKA